MKISGNTVVVAQLVEPQFVVLVVVGSIPIDHPSWKLLQMKQFFFYNKSNQPILSLTC
jgi:hypothetical protein